MSTFNWRTTHGPTDPADRPPDQRPLDVADEEYAAALWRETDRSLKQDPKRWRWTSATETETTTRGRAGAEDAVSPHRARNPSAVERGRQSWETRRRARGALQDPES